MNDSEHTDVKHDADGKAVGEARNDAAQRTEGDGFDKAADMARQGAAKLSSISQQAMKAAKQGATKASQAAEASSLDKMTIATLACGALSLLFTFLPWFGSRQGYGRDGNPFDIIATIEVMEGAKYDVLRAIYVICLLACVAALVVCFLKKGRKPLFVAIPYVATILFMAFIVYGFSSDASSLRLSIDYLIPMWLYFASAIATAVMSFMRMRELKGGKGKRSIGE